MDERKRWAIEQLKVKVDEMVRWVTEAIGEDDGSWDDPIDIVGQTERFLRSYVEIRLSEFDDLSVEDAEMIAEEAVRTVLKR